MLRNCSLPDKSPASMYLILALASLSTVTLLLYRRGRRTDASRPPGPPRLPIIGNLLDIPRSRELLVYNEMADKYGEMVYLSVFDKNIFVVSSARILGDLFTQRSANYCDRPHSTMLNRLMDLEWVFAFSAYGALWREGRKLFHSQFQESVVPDLRPLQIKSAHNVLRRIIASPEDLIRHLHLHVGGFLMEVAYSIEMNAQTAELIGMADDVILAWSKIAVPGAYLVDTLPILRYIPEWLIPGGGFQKDARVAKKKSVTARDVPFNKVLADLADGTATPSFVSNVVNNSGASADLELIKACASTIYFAGTDALAISLHAFILAMIVYPNVQRKAQEELDAVVGKDRLPDFSDQASLPYCNALVKEVLRWHPPAPLGVPHLTVKDDQYNGYHIPAGSIIIGNLWKILHNPEVYPDPTNFKPERFMASENGGQLPSIVLETFEAVFSSGRRICPGRFVATTQLFITIVSILGAFDITPAMDENGNPIKVEPDFTYGLANHPLPFKYSITPRGRHVQELLNLEVN
ncbi:cytochrome P450 monooxygenase [Mycena vulgaris]|nr:cytochrome P450 monooxygenase [Mycena vulgaris]